MTPKTRFSKTKGVFVLVAGVKNWVRFEFPSVPENISFARACVAAFASQLDCTLEEIEELKLVISEAVSNSIIHGYGQRPDGVVILEIKLREEKTIDIVVEDKGCGIADVEHALQPAYSSVSDRMGLGFVFMQSFMEDLEVTSEVGVGTRVHMVKSLLPTGEDFGE
jgi:stage II sporulation protein AB (anti-sigma F factor)